MKKMNKQKTSEAVERTPKYQPLRRIYLYLLVRPNVVASILFMYMRHRETLAPAPPISTQIQTWYARGHTHKRATEAFTCVLNSKTDSSSLPRSPLDRTRSLHCRTHWTNPYMFVVPRVRERERERKNQHPHKWLRASISQRFVALAACVLNAVCLHKTSWVVLDVLDVHTRARKHTNGQTCRHGTHSQARSRIQQARHYRLRRRRLIWCVRWVAQNVLRHNTIVDSHSRRVCDLSFNFICAKKKIVSVFLCLYVL